MFTSYFGSGNNAGNGLTILINDCLPNEQAMIKGSLVLAAAPGIYEKLHTVLLETR